MVLFGLVKYHCSEYCDKFDCDCTPNLQVNLASSVDSIKNKTLFSALSDES